MNMPGPGSRPSGNRLTFPIVGAALFAIVFFVLVLHGGMCERYEAKMRRMELRKQMLDDARRTPD
jgi:hypothetical protein